jgi:hypothetical protein
VCTAVAKRPAVRLHLASEAVGSVLAATDDVLKSTDDESM